MAGALLAFRMETTKIMTTWHSYERPEVEYVTFKIVRSKVSRRSGVSCNKTTTTGKQAALSACGRVNKIS